MSRPTIALACILKNEYKNLNQLASSIRDCFDEVHFTDTGSNDGSVELLKQWANGPNPTGSKVFLHHFQWCDDFSAARNYSFSHPKTDYIMWMDLDDVLSDREGFIHFRDHLLEIAEFWIATYHYAVDGDGRPICSFARERIVKRNLQFHWRYYIHEGIMPVSPVKKDLIVHYATSWNVTHRRDDEDVRKDRSRNLHIMEARKDSFDARMQYYYGKELYENQKPLEGLTELIKAISLPDLELHDRIMGVQYAALCTMQLNQHEKAIQLAHQGLQLDPKRAEFFIVIADSYQKLGRLEDAIAFYRAASSCPYKGHSLVQSAITLHEPSYKHYPLTQLAKLYAHQGNIPLSEQMVAEALAHGPDTEAINIANELKLLKAKIFPEVTVPRETSGEIVITCVPTFYEWDEKVYQERGIGGSETAVVEMAKHLSEISGRTVKVFNMRSSPAQFDNVHYLPMQDAAHYLQRVTPHTHIMWRHNTKMTEAPSYLWCHDLMVPGIEHHGNYKKLLCLSPFHKNLVHGTWRVPLDKIHVTRNGIEPARWFDKAPEKVPYKVVWSSSPDRGLEDALKVMDLVNAEIPESTLHVYYGIENLRKNNKGAEADRIMAMLASRPYVKYHGNLEQRALTRELQTACLWLYPTNFLETFCITALEMLASDVYPVVRRWGALGDTLKDAAVRGMASLVEAENTDHKAFAKEVFEALALRKWEKMNGFIFQQHSWRSVAHEWVEFMGL